jgi:hypothetical protein
MARKTGRSSAADPAHGWSAFMLAAIRGPGNVITSANPFKAACARPRLTSTICSRRGISVATLDPHGKPLDSISITGWISVPCRGCTQRASATTRAC